VPSFRKTQLTFDEAISLPELHLPSCGMIIPYVDAKYITLGSRGLLFQGFLFLTSSKHTLVGKSLKIIRSIHFMPPKKLTHFDPRSTPAHTEYTQ
jgi:hypothetical protein